MKKLVLLMMIVCMAIPCFGDATRWNIQKRPTADWLTGATGNKDTAWAWMKAIDLIVGGMNVNQGTVYYVDNNSGLDTHDGLSWNHAVLTITKAMALSHAMIATSPHYADRNTIFVRGDDFDEDLTKLAQKTDVVGVGSDDSNKGPRILGNHVIEAVGSGNYMGCRLFNITFKPEAAGITVDLPTGQHGIEFHGCKWEWAGGSTTGLRVTTCNGTVVNGCQFIKGDGTGFSTAAISIATGASFQTHITHNWIDSGIGIIVNVGTTGLGNIITDNYIKTVTLTIDENSDTFWIANNTLISDAAYGGSSYDFAVTQSIGNVLTASDGTYYIPTDATLDIVLADTEAMDTSAELVALVDPNYVSYDARRISVGNWNFGADTGAQAAYTLFTVTGDIIATCIGICDIAWEGASTAEVGVSGNTASIITQIADASDLIANEIWHDATPDETVAKVDLMSANEFILSNGQDIILTIGSTNATAGDVDFYLFWMPLSPDAVVVAP